MKKLILGALLLVMCFVAYIIFDEQRSEIKQTTLATLDSRVKLISRYIEISKISALSLRSSADMVYLSDKDYVGDKVSLEHLVHYPEYGVRAVYIEDILPSTSAYELGVFSVLDTVPLPIMRDSNEVEVLRHLIPQLGSIVFDPMIDWAYVISIDGFMYLVPSASLEAHHITPSVFDNPMWLAVSPEQNPKRLNKVSSFYRDSVSGRVMTTLSLPLYDESEFRGVIGIDINLKNIVQMLSVGIAAGESYLRDKNNNVVDSKGELFGADEFKSRVGHLPNEVTGNDGFHMTSAVINQSIYLNHHISHSELNRLAMKDSVPLWAVLLAVYGLVGVAFLKHRTASRNHKLMMLDNLTGALNRRGIETELKSKLVQLEQWGQSYSVIMADIDHFKAINDAYGHDVGDEVIKRVSDEFVSSLRQDCLLSRWGGEEFLIIVPNVDIATARKVAERLRKAIELIQLDGIESRLTVSFGLTIEYKAERFERALKRADKALYQSKHEGRNCVSVLE